MPSALAAGSWARRRLKRILVLSPSMQRYLAEKQELAIAWSEAAAERDQLQLLLDAEQQVLREVEKSSGALQREHEDALQQRNVLVQEIAEMPRAIEEKQAEYRAVLQARDALLAEIREEEAQRTIKAERDAARAECEVLRQSIRDEQARFALEKAAVEAERERVLSEAAGLSAEVEALRSAIETLRPSHDAAIADLRDARLKLEVAIGERNRAFAEVAHCHQVALGKTAILKSKCGSLQRRLERLSVRAGPLATQEEARDLYLTLLEKALVGTLLEDDGIGPGQSGYSPQIRELGRDWPKHACTMIGTARMRNLRELIERVLHERVPGDLLEAGVWRGGAAIFMRGILKAYGDPDRRVFAADSFQGLPPPNGERYEADAGDLHHTFTPLAVPLEEVRDNFRKFGLLDERVCFLEGWFKDTLSQAPIERLALLRLDGDMYESTIQSLDALYWKLSPGGFVIVDDYNLQPCRQATEDFRVRHSITAEIEGVDGAAIYWRKEPGGNREPANGGRPDRHH